MEPKAACLFALVLCAAFAPHCAKAREFPFQGVEGYNSTLAEQMARFDVRQIGTRGTSSDTSDRLSSEALSDDELYRRQKVKIRWTYQPIEGGPQFEIGTYGSRKGAMKKKLLHVAVDWTF